MNEVEIKPAFPYSLKVSENFLVLKQQLKNLKKMIVGTKNTADKEEKNQNSIIKKKDQSSDNSDETESLTIEEILDTLLENEKNEIILRKND